MVRTRRYGGRRGGAEGDQNSSSPGMMGPLNSALGSATAAGQTVAGSLTGALGMGAPANGPPAQVNGPPAPANGSPAPEKSKSSWWNPFSGGRSRRRKSLSRKLLKPRKSRLRKRR